MDHKSLRQKLYTIIFGTSTPAGRLFDLVLIYAIVISIIAVMLDSVDFISNRFALELKGLEWFFTILFTLEYAARIYCSPNPWAYVRSFYGIIDLLSILPSYIGLVFTGASYWLVVRLLRVLRVFRVLKLTRYVGESNILLRSMVQSRRKIFIFFSNVLVLATLLGATMFMVEGPESGFTSIPTSIYWTIVTITTVGYGDITPHTVLGKFIAATTMLIGYSIIAVPTGIITAELAHEIQREKSNTVCPNCGRSGHDLDAQFCRHCGSRFPDKTPPLTEED